MAAARAGNRQSDQWLRMTVGSRNALRALPPTDAATIDLHKKLFSRVPRRRRRNVMRL